MKMADFILNTLYFKSYCNKFQIQIQFGNRYDFRSKEKAVSRTTAGVPPANEKDRALEVFREMQEACRNLLSALIPPVGRGAWGIMWAAFSRISRIFPHDILL